MPTLAKLYNRGPHTIAYRGTVEIQEDGLMVYLDSRAPVQRHHGDVTCPHLDHFHSPLSGLCSPLCLDATESHQ